MRGHLGSAISHLMSGVRILEETVSRNRSIWNRCEKDSSSFLYVSKDKLLVLFNRLGYQAQQVSRLILITLSCGYLQYPLMGS